MTDQEQNTFSFTRLQLVKKDSLITQDLASLKASSPFVVEDFNDEVSTEASSALFSQTTFFEYSEKVSRRSTEVDETPTLNFEEIYERASQFLDKEGLDITSQHPIINCKILKPCIGFSKMLSSPPGTTGGQEENPLTLQLQNVAEKDLQKLAIPKFLAKRAASSGTVSNIKKSPLIMDTKLKRENSLI